MYLEFRVRASLVSIANYETEKIFDSFQVFASIKT